MNKELIRKINSDLNDGRIAVSQATEKILELFEEIERKAYHAGQESILNAEGYYFVNNKKIPAPDMTYDQWKESQKQEQ